MNSPIQITQQAGQIAQTKTAIQKPVQTQLLQPQNASATEIKNWATGQLLKATVLQQLSSSSLLLKVGNLKLTANTNVLLSAGSQINLKVIRTGEQPSLQILQNNSRSAEQTNLNALRQALPKQASLSEFFSNIKTMSAGEQRLPPTVQQALNVIQAGLASRADLTNPEMIKKALKESGVFLESNLSKSSTTKLAGSNPVEGDLKGRLLRLVSLISNESTNSTKQTEQKQSASNNSLLNFLSNNKLMPELQRHVESALARIQLNQLNSLPGLEQNQQAILLELPVKEKDKVDIFSLKITEEEDQKEEQEAQKKWAINLSFKLEGLGNLHAKLILGGQKIQASLWAEDQNTFELIQNNMDLLQQRLTDVEFIHPTINCYKGKPEVTNSISVSNKELIDIKI
ncbi:MAG: flagellar hook-length control protein FliK [Gammaproteobacteria bacterium]